MLGQYWLKTNKSNTVTLRRRYSITTDQNFFFFVFLLLFGFLPLLQQLCYFIIIWLPSHTLFILLFGSFFIQKQFITARLTSTSLSKYTSIIYFTNSIFYFWDLWPLTYKHLSPAAAWISVKYQGSDRPAVY